MNDTAPNVDTMRILIGVQNPNHFATAKQSSKEKHNSEKIQISDSESSVQFIHKYMMENEWSFGLVAQSLVGSFSEKMWSQNYKLSFSALR